MIIGKVNDGQSFLFKDRHNNRPKSVMHGKGTDFNWK